MSDSARWHRFDLERVGHFIDRNLAELKLDVTMDPETLRDISQARGIFVEMDAIGWNVVKHTPGCSGPGKCEKDCVRLVVATLPYGEALNDKADRNFYARGKITDPAKRPFFSMFKPK